MQVLINEVLTESGIYTPPWQKGRSWEAHNQMEYIRQAREAYARRRGKRTPLPPMKLAKEYQPDNDLDDLPDVSIFQIMKHGKLVHESENLTAALREVAWRDWKVGEDGVNIVERETKGGTKWGRGRPHRYGGAWPDAKKEEFVRLYSEGMSPNELSDRFDCAVTMLTKKAREFGLAKRR